MTPTNREISRTLQEVTNGDHTNATVRTLNAGARARITIGPLTVSTDNTPEAINKLAGKYSRPVKGLTRISSRPNNTQRPAQSVITDFINDNEPLNAFHYAQARGVPLYYAINNTTEGYLLIANAQLLAPDIVAGRVLGQLVATHVPTGRKICAALSVPKLKKELARTLAARPNALDEACEQHGGGFQATANSQLAQLASGVT